MDQRPPSILIFNRTFPPAFGATGRVACDLALHLRAKGHPVTVITTATTPKIDKAKNLTVIRVEGSQKPESAWAYYRIYRRMAGAAKKLPHHDIVISLTDPPMIAYAAHRVAQKMKAKHIHWVMDLYPDLFPVLGKKLSFWTRTIMAQRMKKALKSADAIVPISGCMARYLTHHSLPRKNMTVIENWAEKALYDDTPDDQLRPLFSNQESKFRILYAGTMGLAHDFTSILKAANYLQSRHPEIEFVFVGKGRALESIIQAKTNQKLDNIRLIPHQPSSSLESLMKAGDVHLVTMKAEASGLLYPSKFYSACAAARPVIFIGPETCDIHKAVTQNECGTSVRNNDPQSLIRAILAYRHDGGLWHTHASNTQKITANSPAKNFQQWDDLIASIT